MFAIRPGAVAPPRSLQAMLRDIHEERRASRQREIDERAKHGVPLDDSTKWADLAPCLLALNAGVEKRDTADVRKHAMALLASTAGALKPLDPYEDDPEIEGVDVSLRLVAKSVVDDMQIASAAGAYDGTDPVKWMEAQKANRPVLAAFVAACVAEVRGLVDGGGSPLRATAMADGTGEDVGQLPPSALDLLEANDLMGALFRVALEFQQMRPTRRQRFGQRLPLTSGTTTAPGALVECVTPAGATATAAPSTSLGTATQPVAALDATFSTTLRLDPSTSSTAPPTAGRSDSTCIA